MSEQIALMRLRPRSQAAARECKLIGLKPLGIDQSDEFIKTLFVQFAMSAELRQINGIIREAANDSSQYRTKTALEFAVQEPGSRNPAANWQLQSTFRFPK